MEMNSPYQADIAQSCMRKVAWRIVPVCAALYLLAYLDRVNVGFAALTMNADLQLSATAYGTAAGIFFVGYVLFEVPSNILLARVGARIWLARIIITWGLMSAAMALAQGALSLSVLRFFLGVAEAGLLPGVLFYMAQWFPAARRTAILSSFFIALPTAFIIGAPISTAFLSLDWLGLHGWQWMFIIEGLFTAVVGVGVFLVMIDRPEQAKWLTEAERAWLTKTLADEYAARGGEKVAGVRHGLMNPQVWLLGATYAGVIATSGCFGFWLPLIIKSTGNHTNFEIGLLTAAPYAVSIFAILLWSRHSAKTQELTWHICLPIILAAIGFAWSASTADPQLMMLIVFANVVLVYLVPPLFWAMATKTMNGPAAAAGIALINCIASTGSYFGPQLMGYLKDRTNGFAAGLLMLCGFLLVSAALTFFVGRRVEARA